MFVRINKERIRISSIGSYEDKGKSSVTQKYYLDIKISGKLKSFWFDTEQELKAVVDYLDDVLKVKVI